MTIKQSMLSGYLLAKTKAGWAPKIHGNEAYFGNVKGVHQSFKAVRHVPRSVAIEPGITGAETRPVVFLLG